MIYIIIRLNKEINIYDTLKRRKKSLSNSDLLSKKLLD